MIKRVALFAGVENKLLPGFVTVDDDVDLAETKATSSPKPHPGIRPV